jgi:hypothetical protein
MLRGGGGCPCAVALVPLWEVGGRCGVRLSMRAGTAGSVGARMWVGATSATSTSTTALRGTSWRRLSQAFFSRRVGPEFLSCGVPGHGGWRPAGGMPPQPSSPYGLCVGQTRYIGRANLTKRLARLEGAVGHTCYRNDSARIELAGGTLTVTPPFGLAHEGEYEQVVVGPLLEALGEDHTVAALLVRLGGYALGTFVGERLVASKVGSRFVKGRHRAGGSSANRFRRRREGQERELVEEAAAEAARVLTPWQGKLEWIALGGDRTATHRVLAARADLAWMQPLALERFFAVPEPRRRILDELPYPVSYTL